MTAYAKLAAYVSRCNNGSQFTCFLMCGSDRSDRIWEATIRLWWLNLNPLKANGRTRTSACQRLVDTLAEDWGTEI